MYYDRRKGYYKDKGQTPSRIISVMELVKATVCIVLQRPDDARARSGDYIKDDDQYESIFGKDRFPLGVYLKCVQIVRGAEEFLDGRPEIEKGDELNIKFYLASEVARRATGQATPTPEALLLVDVTSLASAAWESAFRHVWTLYVKLGKGDTLAKGPDLVKKLRASAWRRARIRKLRR
jgi:hypothetical protein